MPVATPEDWKILHELKSTFRVDRQGGTWVAKIFDAATRKIYAQAAGSSEHNALVNALAVATKAPRPKSPQEIIAEAEAIRDENEALKAKLKELESKLDTVLSATPAPASKRRGRRKGRKPTAPPTATEVSDLGTASDGEPTAAEDNLS